MLFGVMEIMAGIKKAGMPNMERYDYADEPRSFNDMLRSPMTLSQGAAIMNEYRRINGDIHG